MAEGVVHAKDSVKLTVPAGIVASGMVFFVSRDPILAAFAWPLAAWGCLCSIVLSPDLDQVGKTHSEKVVFEETGCGWPFFVYWYPYAKWFRHRSPPSHRPVYSTFIRQVYAFWWLSLVILFVGLKWGLWPTWWMGFGWLMWFFGLCVGDFAHWMRDDRP